MQDSVCRAALLPESLLDKQLTEKGVLQLLFDLRFLRDVLSAGKPAAAFQQGEDAQAQVRSDLAKQREEFEALESDLQVTPLPTSQLVTLCVSLMEGITGTDVCIQKLKTRL